MVCHRAMVQVRRGRWQNGEVLSWLDAPRWGGPVKCCRNIHFETENWRTCWLFLSVFLKDCLRICENSLYRRYHWSESTWVMMTPNICSSCFKPLRFRMFLGIFIIENSPIYHDMRFNIWWLYTCWCSFTLPHDLFNKFVASIEIPPSKKWRRWRANGWLSSWRCTRWIAPWRKVMKPGIFRHTCKPEVWRSDIWRPKLCSESTWRSRF